MKHFTNIDKISLLDQSYCFDKLIFFLIIMIIVFIHLFDKESGF